MTCSTSTEPSVDAVYDWADAILEAMEAAPDTWFTPSAVARKAGLTTSQAVQALLWMDRGQYVAGSGNGAWRKYAAKRAGNGSYR